jgi:predicted alpha/beta-hydrolase family hydrolase
VTGFLVLLAPGAGAPSSSDWMTGWADRLRTLPGAPDVVPMDYPYQKAGKKRPDRHEVLVAAHRAALDEARAGRPESTVVLAGKSMGGRIGCHLSLEVPVQALVCFGYPLISQSGKVRDEVLVALRTPVLFVQGTRDPMCPLPRLAAVRERMEARSELHVVDTGDHSLEITREQARVRSQHDHDQDVLAAVGRFLGRTLRSPHAADEGP